MNKEKQYIQAFNNGYFLAKYKPQIFATLMQTPGVPSNNYLKGFYSGKQNLDIDILNEKIAQINQLRSQAIKSRNGFKNREL